MSQTKQLGVLSIALLSASAIISLRNFPATALLGTQAIFFLLAAAVCFFIPVALACAELTSAWPDKGGVYTWVRHALGPHWALIALWLQWIEAVIFLPALLTSITTIIAYLVAPKLADHRLFVAALTLFILWGATFLNYRGLKLSRKISNLGVLFGTILPGVILILLGIRYIPEALAKGHLDFGDSAASENGKHRTFHSYFIRILWVRAQFLPCSPNQGSPPHLPTRPVFCRLSDCGSFYFWLSLYRRRRSQGGY